MERDGRTDGQIPQPHDGIAALCIASRDENGSSECFFEIDDSQVSVTAFLKWHTLR